MKFIMKHKLAVFLFTLLLAGVAAILIFGKTINFDESQAIYGNRLDGIKEVQISKAQMNEVETKVNAEKVNVRVSGKVVYIIIYTPNEMDQATAKSLGEKALEPFTADQKSFYDFQILIDNDSNKEQFPILGYKHRAKDTITWTKDR